MSYGKHTPPARLQSSLSAPDIYHRPDWSGTTTKITITTGAAVLSSALNPGRYLVKSDVSFYMRQGASGVSAAAAADTWPFEASTYYPVHVNDPRTTAGADTYLSFRANSGDGSVWLKKVG